ncbi:MAG: hypothetical protein ACLQDV_14975 [Candidatus Binataceae bacterium]
MRAQVRYILPILVSTTVLAVMLTRHKSGFETQPAYAATSTPTPSLYLSGLDTSSGMAAVEVYPTDATGSATPGATIEGTNAAFNTNNMPTNGIAADSSQFFVATGQASTSIFPVGATGNATPAAILNDSNTVYGVAIDSNYVYCTTQAPSLTQGPTVDIFPINAASGSSPSAVLILPGNISTDAANGIAVDANNIYVTNGLSKDIYEYPVSVASSTGTISPTPSVTISGSSTGLNSPYGIAVNSSTIFVANNNRGANSVTEYPVTATGNATPSVTLTSSLDGPAGIAVDSSTIYVVSQANSVLVEYPVGAINRCHSQRHPESFAVPAAIRRDHASHWYADRNRDCHSDRDRYSNRDCHGNRDCNSHRECHADSECHGRDSHGDRNGYFDIDSNRNPDCNRDHDRERHADRDPNRHGHCECDSNLDDER